MEPSLPTLSSASGTTDSSGKFTSTFTLDSFQPGNNYRVVAAGRQEDLDRSKARAHDEQSEVFFDENDNNTHDAGEVLLDEVLSVNGCVATRLLTVWRYLHVEVDSMGAEPAGTTFPADDLLRGDIDDPDISGLSSAFEDAYIEIKTDTGNDDDDTPWKHSFANTADVMAYATGTNGKRGTGESNAYWAVYVAGIYEIFTSGADNDPNTGGGVPALGGNVEVAPDFAVIAMVTIRDVADQWSWTASEKEHAEQKIVVHEIGHQFGLVDVYAATPTHVMWSFQTEAGEDLLPEGSMEFQESDILIIRKTVMP